MRLGLESFGKEGVNALLPGRVEFHPLDFLENVYAPRRYADLEDRFRMADKVIWSDCRSLGPP
jgi:hypothetical protein